MKIAVTGAAGFIGSHLAERLSKEGHQVIGIDAVTDYYSPTLKKLNIESLIKHDVAFHQVDLLDDTLATILDGVEIVYHLAAQPGISATVPFSTYMRNNLEATHHLVETCRELSNFGCFINISTSSVYGKHATVKEDATPKPTSYYGVTKLAAEQLVLAYQRDKGLPATSMRLYSVCGPRERPEKLFTKLIRCILEERPFTLFEGSEDHSRSFTYVGDIVAGLVAALSHLNEIDGEIFNIGTTEEHTTGEGIKMIEQIMGKKAQIVTKPRRPGDQLRTCADIDKAHRLLGYSPKTSLYEALEAQAAWYGEKIHRQVGDKTAV